MTSLDLYQYWEYGFRNRIQDSQNYVQNEKYLRSQVEKSIDNFALGLMVFTWPQKSLINFFVEICDNIFFYFCRSRLLVHFVMKKIWIRIGQYCGSGCARIRNYLLIRTWIQIRNDLTNRIRIRNYHIFRNINALKKTPCLTAELRWIVTYL